MTTTYAAATVLILLVLYLAAEFGRTLAATLDAVLP